MNTEVQTSHGRINGQQEGSVVVFRGIPFARPPVGELRFQPPQPPEPWSDVLNAHEFSKSAVQSELPTETGELIGIATDGVSEDCLYLNVWTPALDDLRRPVMVWIHGGGNTVGSASQPRFDGQYLAATHDVVVVSVNYRLGALGFLHLPEIGASGNEALLDQIAGLRWVRSEISAFGGDDRNVTVFGQSAGGFDIGKLLGMPQAAGCFDKAIPMSGAVGPEIPREVALANAARLVDHFGSVEALQNAPAEEILAQQGGGLGGWSPVLDGEVIRDPVVEQVRNGSSKGIPLLVGTTLNEGTLFTLFNPRNRDLPDEGLARIMNSVFGDSTDSAIATYRAAAPSLGISDSNMDILGAFTTDRMFRNTAILTAELQSDHADVWMYLFDYPTPAAGGQLHSCHSFDIPFIFGTYQIPSMQVFCGEGEQVAHLSRVMMATYASFARHGNPNHDELPDWPTYDETSRATMRLGARCALEHAPLEEIRQLWEAAG